MRNRIGPPVEGEDFYGKTKEINFSWELIKDGNNLILAAPRRVGKTSFAKKLIAKARKEKWRTLELNLEGVKTEQAFIENFINALKKTNWWSGISNKASELLNQIEISVELNEIKTNLAWKTKKEKIFNELENLFEHNKPTLIFIDELGVFLNKYEEEENIRDAEFFLNWLRSIRQISNTKIKWVFCSSIGVKNFTSRHQISYTINDVEPNKIEAFEKTTAQNFIKELAKSKKIKIFDEAIQEILNQLEWYLPYFLQLYFKEIYAITFQNDIIIDKQIVIKAFENLSENSHLDTWDERLKYYYTKETVARKILNHLAQKKINAISRKQFFNLVHNPNNLKVETTEILGDTLRMLINDGYMIQDKKDKFRFRSPLLKKYWYNKFLR